MVIDRRYDDFEGRARLSTWIRQICFRVAMANRRRVRRRREELVAELPETTMDADQDAGLELLHREALLNALLDELDDVHRQIVVLSEIEQLCMREVAQRVGCPLQTACARRNAALARMRTSWIARASGE